MATLWDGHDDLRSLSAQEGKSSGQRLGGSLVKEWEFIIAIIEVRTGPSVSLKMFHSITSNYRPLKCGIFYTLRSKNIQLIDKSLWCKWEHFPDHAVLWQWPISGCHAASHHPSVRYFHVTAWSGVCLYLHITVWVRIFNLDRLFGTPVSYDAGKARY